MGYTGKSNSQEKKAIANANQKWLERKPRGTKQEKKHPWKRSISELKAARDKYLAKYPKAKWAVEQIIRDDKGNLVEDVCEHGCGHPNRTWLELHDPDGKKAMGIHGCCGCCDDLIKKPKRQSKKKVDSPTCGCEGTFSNQVPRVLEYPNYEELAC